VGNYFKYLASISNSISNSSCRSLHKLHDSGYWLIKVYVSQKVSNG